MSNFNRFVQTLKSTRQLSRAIMMAGLFIAVLSVQTSNGDHASGFGKVHFPITCSANVQEKFDQALAMLYCFSFPDAAQTFTAVVQEDPNCAMAYWGLAATAIGSLYGGRPGPMTLKGESAVQKAKAIGGKTIREQDYISTMEVFYKDANSDYAKRLRDYTDALEQLQRKYPYDREAEIFYAYALTALGSPTDKTFTYQLKGAEILEKLLKELPNHPGVIHYLLHAYDHTSLAPRGLQLARRVANAGPSSPHLLQFPAHIFVRLGLWQESIETNIKGAAVQDPFFKPHAMDFLVYSYLQTGQDSAAKRVLDEATKIKMIPHILDAYAIAAMPARFALERHQWDEATVLSLPHNEFEWKLFPHAEAALVFARALGNARNGNIDAAMHDLEHLKELRNELIKADSEGIWQEFWISELDIHRDMVTAWITYSQGNSSEALRILRSAADHEDSSEKDPVMPSSIISARQLLGEMLLELNNAQEALKEFEAALKEEPGRFRSLYGAARAAELAGDLTLARAFYNQLIVQCRAADTERSELKLVKAFVEKQ